MKTHIVRIANSQGVRIPKLLLQQAGLPEEVEIQAGHGRIVIEAAFKLRAGWAEAAKLVCERGEDGLLDEPTSTR
jgi:antitoxin MazE